MINKNLRHYYDSILYNLEVIEQHTKISFKREIADYLGVSSSLVEEDALTSDNLYEFIDKLKFSTKKNIITKCDALYSKVALVRTYTSIPYVTEDFVDCLIENVTSIYWDF